MKNEKCSIELAKILADELKHPFVLIQMPEYLKNDNKECTLITFVPDLETAKHMIKDALETINGDFKENHFNEN